MPRTTKKKAVGTPRGTTDLLVQMMNDMNAKLHTIHKEVARNSKDIENVKQEIAFGRGGVKVLVWIIGMATTLIAVWKFFFWSK